MSAEQREAEAAALLAQGYTAGIVAMRTGLTLAAVDRLAGQPTTKERLQPGYVPPSGREWALIVPHPRVKTEDAGRDVRPRRSHRDQLADKRKRGAA